MNFPQKDLDFIVHVWRLWSHSLYECICLVYTCVRSPWVWMRWRILPVTCRMASLSETLGSSFSLSSWLSNISTREALGIQENITTGKVNIDKAYYIVKMFHTSLDSIKESKKLCKLHIIIELLMCVYVYKLEIKTNLFSAAILGLFISSHIQ